MGLARKLSMLSASLRLGRTLRDKLCLVQLCLKHGGLMGFGGGPLSAGTIYAGAPVLHWRDASADAILFVEVVIEEDYQCLRGLGLRPSHILDIGANIGLGSFFMRGLYPTAKITAFEPSDAEALVLNRNFASWKDCVHLAMAVGDVDGTVEFAIDLERTGGQHIADGSEDGAWHRVTVPCCRIETMIDAGTIATPDLVKMDIEGAEVGALRGFGRHLSAPQAYVLETHSAALHSDCLALLSAAGYRVVWDTSRGGEARVLCMAK
jgi:FkbM family methyltransferase